MTLSERQSELARALSAPQTIWPDELVREIAPGGTLDAAGALGVYRSGYVARLTEQLGETYETVWRVLGDDAFFDACERYIRTHPSTSYNLSDYGREFPDFLETLDDAPAPFLGELAAFELAFHDLFHAPPHDSLDAPALAQSLADPDDLANVRFRFDPAMRLVACRHAVFDLFRHRNETEAPDLDVERPQWLVLYKQHGDVRVHEVDCRAFAALSALAEGLPVGDALARAATGTHDGDELGPDEVAGLFEFIARSGIVTGFDR